MKLYTFFRSSAAYRLRIALNLKGLDYESISVSLPGMEHRAPGYAAVNPQRLVPALVDGSTTLIQSVAMMEYLDETHPEPPFLPTDPIDRAYVRALTQLIACDIHPLNNVRVLKYLQEPLGHDEATRNQWYAHWITEGFSALEALLNQQGKAGRYCHGDRVGMADICLVPQVFNAQRFKCATDPYPTVMRIFEECQALGPFARAHPEAQPDAV